MIFVFFHRPNEANSCSLGDLIMSVGKRLSGCIFQRIILINQITTDPLTRWTWGFWRCFFARSAQKCNDVELRWDVTSGNVWNGSELIGRFYPLAFVYPCALRWTTQRIRCVWRRSEQLIGRDVCCYCNMTSFRLWLSSALPFLRDSLVWARVFLLLRHYIESKNDVWRTPAGINY